jgi:hypothetical protein
MFASGERRFQSRGICAKLNGEKRGDVKIDAHWDL